MLAVSFPIIKEETIHFVPAFIQIRLKESTFVDSNFPICSALRRSVEEHHPLLNL